jgi:predicted ester cyclase
LSWLVVLLAGALALSGCVASDGTVYTLQPVAAAAQPAGGAAAEANKELILQYFADLNQDKSPATVDKYMTDEVLKHHIEIFEAAFPGYQLAAEEMAAEDNQVIVWATFTGTHDGDLMGIAPTGKPVEIPIALVYWIEDGKIADHLMLADQLTMLQQIGVLPAP